MPYTAGQFYNDEYNRLINKQDQAVKVLGSQQRLSALNDSYRKRYAKYIEMMMVLILAYAIYLGVSMLQKSVPAIPSLVVDVVIVVLILFVVFYMYFAFMTLMSRDVLDYDELDIPPIRDGTGVVPLDASGQAAAVGTGLLGPSGESCVGSDCCATTTSWNETTQKCNFTTLEFSPIDRAYTDLSFQDSSLKRAPTMGPVGIDPSPTSLTFSKV
jgi:hypothetical protein